MKDPSQVRVSGPLEPYALGFGEKLVKPDFERHERAWKKFSPTRHETPGEFSPASGGPSSWC